MSTTSDEELMQRYVAGDEAAFQDLFKRFAPRLTSMMRRHIASEQDVQDLVQQTFFQLHRARFDFHQGSQVRPWLYTIALNLKRRHFRDKGKAGASLELDPAAKGPTASDKAVAVEDVKALRLALLDLPDNQREVIELHWFQGLPMSEVAQQVGASLSAVKVRAHRGYKKLREILKEAGNRSGRAG